jgi:hypothetical protein
LSEDDKSHTERNLAAALELARAGIPVFPAHIFRKQGNAWGKKPAIGGWKEAATCDEVQIRAWWGNTFPKAVPGIALGRIGLAMLDAGPP